MELTVQTLNSQSYPNDWKKLNLGKSSILKARIGWQGLTTAEYLDSGDYFLVTGTDFKNGYIDWDNCVYVEKLRYDQDTNIQIKIDDIVVTKDGTIGKVAFIERVLKPTTLNSGVFVIRPINKSYYPRYFYYILMSEHFSDFLSKLTAGSTISHLYQKDFVHYNFPLPPTLVEQKAIATALSEVDSLITQLDKLLTKKRNLKQGAMQQLLTGKTRLPGFSGKWIEKKLNKCLSENPKYGIGAAAIDYNLNYPTYLRITDISDEGILIKTGLKSVNHSESDNYYLKEGDIVFARTGASVGKSYLYNVKDGKLVYAGFLIKMSPNKNILDSRFLKAYVNSKPYWDWVIVMSMRSGQPGINSQEFGAIMIPLPPSLEEQQAIATLLSDMDAEIEALENKKAKCQGIKQGMMQELLTGKTRLI